MENTKIGRPRCEKAQQAVMKATHELLNEKGGSGLTIEGIAKRAKVGKPTIYRWWPSLADIVLDVVLRQAGTDIPVIKFESLEKTLHEFLRQSMKATVDWGGAHLRFLIAHAQKDEDFRKRFRNNFSLTRRSVLLSIFQQAVERGEISPEQNLEILTDLIFGSMWYRLLIGHAPMDMSFAEELTEITIQITKNKSTS
ncbi:TetR/AcrR family transcriptional regulator [Halodesulfovibrio marinisediminis]|uniref:Transcriptional regulator, TetR family n=1 Tax=Halodesulfovibrio marinisediminis DSM 17456 TaxID=1121457 RepID=A0A1N6H5J5_9BACT|nr:TetR/AcrR family transcriptional regulator [Halodesulfovibrio marinisediminis]SIO15002.1 transcriptional regulator, TetR family [Halodesulfovibrio marinisediminis DSM 17456]